MTEKFLQEIELKRFLCKRDFFSDYIDKNQIQTLMQSINSLCLYELNKVKQNLNLVNEKFADLTPIPDEFNIDYEEAESFAGANLRNKKVVIFTCSYGNGHKITAAAIEQTLQKASAHPVIYDLSVGPLLGKDRWRQLFKLFGIQYGDRPISGVDIFNEILRHQFYFIVNAKDAIDAFVRKMLDISGKDGVISPLGLWTNSWEKTQIRELLFIERPDHIITTYHMDLNPILEVAEELGIPLLHIPTDYDMKFREVFGKKTTEYPHFKSLVPNYAIEETLQTQNPLRSDQLVEKIGIPLRPEFYQFLDREELLSYRRSRGIADDEKILLISAGGNGQNLPHPEHLANSPTWDLPLRVLVIAGKNRDFATHLQYNLKSQNGNSCILKGKNPNVTIEIVTNPDLDKIIPGLEFFIQADQLSKILDISDASIAKAGGLSVAELLFKGVPIVFDLRVNPFSWELFNLNVAISRQMAISNYYLKNLEQDLKQIFEIPKNQNFNFYFESALESFCQCLNDQIHQVESDEGAISKKGHLILENLKE